MILTAALLAGCAAVEAPAPPPVVRVVDTACSWVRVITLSADDTSETKRQVLAHDMAVLNNCPNGNP